MARRNRSAREVEVASVWEDGDVDSLHMAVTAFDKPVLRALEKQLRDWGFRGAQVGSWGSGDGGGITVYVGDEEFRFELAEVAMTANGRRIAYPPGTRYSVQHVLAGAYRGRDISERALLSHAVIQGEDKTLCRRLGTDRLPGYDEDDSDVPTCETCAERLARIPGAVHDPEAIL
jgi:hypothetical protein